MMQTWDDFKVHVTICLLLGLLQHFWNGSSDYSKSYRTFRINFPPKRRIYKNSSRAQTSSTKYTANKKVNLRFFPH